MEAKPPKTYSWPVVQTGGHACLPTSQLMYLQILIDLDSGEYLLFRALCSLVSLIQTLGLAPQE